MISKEWIRVADAAHFTAAHNNEGIIILQRVYLETIAPNANCAICDESMKWSACNDHCDGYRWKCRRTIDKRKHRSERSIRYNRWFENANLSLEEALKFTYWWTEGLKQWQIKRQFDWGQTLQWTGTCSAAKSAK